MAENQSQATTKTGSGNSGRRTSWLSPSFFLSTTLAILLLSSSVAVAYYYKTHKPEAKRKRPQRNARLVETIDAALATHRIVIPAMGEVEAARVARIQPRVTGQVVQLDDRLAPGSIFKEGEPLVGIDSRDYELTLAQRESDLSVAASNLAIERGQQAVAAFDYERITNKAGTADRDLMLRKPQLQSAQASVDAAKAAVDQAKLNLDRTTVRAPFNGVVQSRDVNLGMQVSNSTSLVTLLGTDEFWVVVSVPADRLKWISIPGMGLGEGASVRVFNESAWGPNVWREGRVISRAPDLETRGRMARLIVAVDDPLSLKPDNSGAPVLLVGSYVRVEVEGSELNDVFVIDRALIHEGNQMWVMTDEGKLDIRAISIVYRGPETVCVASGISRGDRIVTTNLSAPVQDMALRTAGEEPGGRNKTSGGPDKPPQQRQEADASAKGRMQ